MQTAVWRVSWSHRWPPAREAAKKAMSDGYLHTLNRYYTIGLA